MTSYQLHKVLVIDGRDHVMGRLASTIAKHLMMGTRIIVLRAERIVMSGHLIRNKLKMMSFRQHKMNTNPLRGPFQMVRPCMMFYRIVRGMIPHKTPHGRRMLSKLTIYDGVPPRYNHCKKMKVITAYRHIKLDPNRPYTSLGRLMTCFGWNHGKLMVKLENKRRIKLAQTWKIQKEIMDLKKKATMTVAKRYLEGKGKEDYEWLTQYECCFPTKEAVENPVVRGPKEGRRYRGLDEEELKKDIERLKGEVHLA